MGAGKTGRPHALRLVVAMDCRSGPAAGPERQEAPGSVQVCARWRCAGNWLWPSTRVIPETRRLVELPEELPPALVPVEVLQLPTRLFAIGSHTGHDRPFPASRPVHL